MTDTLHIPAHIDMTRRIAVQQTADVTRLTVAEQQLSAQYDEHQRDAAAERARIEAELRELREKAERRLNALDEAGKRLSAALSDVGQRILQHAEDAREAQRSVADWCTHRGIDPASLPPLPDTGPLPVVPAEPKALPAPPPTFIDSRGHLREGESPCVRGEHARCAGCSECPQGCHPDDSQPLPPVDNPTDLLAMGQRMADPGATRTDLPGGDQPGPGEFQGPADA